MTRYLVTGGAGLVGSHIADLLVQEPDATVVALDDLSRGRQATSTRQRVRNAWSWWSAISATVPCSTG